MQYFANDSALQFTHRELTRIIKSPRQWLGLAAIVIVLAIIGPFYTFASLPFVERLIYWSLMAVVNYLIGYSVSVFTGHIFYRKGAPEWLSRMIAGLVSGIPIAGFVWLVNVYFYRFDMSGNLDFLRLLAYCVVIAMVISMLFYMVSLEFRKFESTGENQPLPPFFRRLPPHLGREILSLEAQDHYVNVTTAKGSKLILIRLSDAINELAGIEGLRIHRSYWVAKSAIATTSREGGKLLINLSNGKSLPVSRTYAGNVRKSLTQTRANA